MTNSKITYRNRIYNIDLQIETFYEGEEVRRYRLNYKSLEFVADTLDKVVKSFTEEIERRENRNQRN